MILQFFNYTGDAGRPGTIIFSYDNMDDGQTAMMGLLILCIGLEKHSRDTNSISKLYTPYP